MHNGECCIWVILLLLQRSLLPGGIILQGPMSVFCMPLRLGANWGYWPSDSVFHQGGGAHHKLLSIGTRYKEPRFYVSFEGREQSK
jgi:hypothetical protein